MALGKLVRIVQHRDEWLWFTKRYFDAKSPAAALCAVCQILCCVIVALVLLLSGFFEVHAFVHAKCFLCVQLDLSLRSSGYCTSFARIFSISSSGAMLSNLLGRYLIYHKMS